jgi:hypothetical protein
VEYSFEPKRVRIYEIGSEADLQRAKAYPNRIVASEVRNGLLRLKVESRKFDAIPECGLIPLVTSGWEEPEKFIRLHEPKGIALRQ